MPISPRKGRSNALVAILLAPFLAPAALRADLDEEIGEATDLGIQYLLKAIEAVQAQSGGHDGYKNGKIALETYALVVAGVSVEHPVVQKNFETLSHIGFEQTYTNACYAFALDAAISQLQSDAALASPSQKMRDDPSIGGAYRARLEAAVNGLIKMRRKSGGWNYTADGSRFDNSNTQFAVLGLGVGAKRKVSIPREVWEEIAVHFTRGQMKEGPETLERPEYYPEDEKGEGKRERINIVDKKSGEKVDLALAKKGAKKEDEKKERKGSPTAAVPAAPEKKIETGSEASKWFARGWDYDNKGAATWNMTCGGLSSLIIAEENLRAQVPPDFQARMAKSIHDGYAWLMKNWNFGGGEWKYYGIYSLEKVADLGEVKKFGSHDWYLEAANVILAEQRADGSWPGNIPEHVRWNSAFALLILNRATSLITQGRSAGKAGKVMLTGSIRRDKEISPDRNWVYIPDYEREFHIPSLLRQVKLRPNRMLLRILEQALKYYPEEQKGLLVSHLARSREAQKHKSVRSFFEDQLNQIVGVRYETIEDYEAWGRRWVDVQRIGTEAQDPQNFLELSYRKTGKSLPLRKKIIWAVARCKSQKLAPQLIEDLSHGEADVRQAAYEALSLLRLSKDPIPPFDPKAEGAAGEAQRAAVQDWYKKRKPAA